MSADPRSILDDLVLTPVEGIDGRYTLNYDAGWRVLYVFGGVTFATGVEAVQAALGREDLVPISAQATYIEPIVDGQAIVQVDVIRSGKRGAQARAQIWQSDDPTETKSPAITMDVMLGAPDERIGGFTNTTMPAEAGAPGSGITRDEMSDRFIDVPFHHQTDFRMVDGLNPAHLGDPRSVSWFKMERSPIDDSGAWRPSVLGLPGDILGPAIGRGMRGERYFVVTLQLSIQWFAPLRTEWVCQHATGVHAGQGFTTGTAELWSGDGELVAFATQTALMRPFERVISDGFAAQETQG